MESIFQCAFRAPLRDHTSSSLAKDFALGLLLTWANSIGSGEPARTRRLAWTFAIPLCYNGSFSHVPAHLCTYVKGIKLITHTKRPSNPQLFTMKLISCLLSMFDHNNQICAIKFTFTIFSLRVLDRQAGSEFSLGLLHPVGNDFACLFVLRFYDPVNPMGSCQAWSVLPNYTFTGQA